VINPDITITVVGLGYVGLPLAAEFGKKYDTLGFDIDEKRVSALQNQVDKTGEISPAEFAESQQLRLTARRADISGRDVYIVTVPTPIDDEKRPDLKALRLATETVAGCMKQGAVVIYESTVYPGATEEVCVPILERVSGMAFNTDFSVGYSPERINPGDKQHRLTSILKVTSGSNPEAAKFVDDLYQSIIVAGTYRAESIKVAEAAKVIENTQRDLNIALINELSIIFARLGIDTHQVLNAAATKWNFLNFKPGLVGGHCIGVDPYYLTHKSQQVGYAPEVILAGRRINDEMGQYVVGRLVKLMIHRRIHVRGARVLVLGIAFKENCPDIRNSRVIDIIRELATYGAVVDVYDPMVDADDVLQEYGIGLLPVLGEQQYEAVVLAVPHEQILAISMEQIRAHCVKEAVVFDVKGAWPLAAIDGRL
jgi:UDP-N-acetyl-D-glucosamine/UDP-N-acetyl-D-galactosamine dehydrogenase